MEDEKEEEAGLAEPRVVWLENKNYRPCGIGSPLPLGEGRNWWYNFDSQIKEIGDSAGGADSLSSGKTVLCYASWKRTLSHTSCTVDGADDDTGVAIWGEGG
jgi:hypothetical protein